MAEPTPNLGSPHAEPRLVGGLWCEQVLAMLPDLLMGEASPTDTAAARAHLEGCSVCTRFGGQYSESIAALRERFATVVVPPGFAARLRQRRER
jgi:hypothetical protein